MAYRLKTVRYEDADRKILLQNENGPCPLLAVANALLLKGVISLPSACIRNGVASIDDVVNILAERALASASHEHHLNELLQLFPKLQYGMDVNPKFTAGPTGVEYTFHLTAFDLLNVELVHGWLLDPQDGETAKVLGNRTYNEIIEIVVRGNEAATVLEAMETDISEKRKELEGLAASEDGEWVNVSEEAKDTPESEVKDPPLQETTQTEVDEAHTVDEKANSLTAENDSEEVPEVSETPVVLTKEERVVKLKQEIDELQTKHEKLAILSVESSVVNSFLSATSHQLTHYGLHELYNYVSDDALCVFFRNNHFATLTKKQGVLYLLVTDLGYANVPEVMWEKLDGIDGDTEYVSHLFVKPAPQKELLPASGAALSPEQLLAQRGQSEADYQLALELSRHATSGTGANLDEAEGKLVAAATEASLRTYNGVPDEETKAQEPHDASWIPSDGGMVDGCTTQEDSDKLIAMQLQAQESQEDESMILARQLQAEENRMANARTTASRNSQNSSSSSSSGCIIS